MAVKLKEEAITDYIGMNVSSKELKQLEDELLKDFDINEVTEAHARELGDLARALESLEQIKEEYDPALHARQSIEEAYLTVMYLTYRLARRFNPLTSYGRDLLMRAEALRKEYEAGHAPLVAAVSAENTAMFEGLISDDVREEIEAGRWQALGIMRTDFIVTRPVAACAYRWIEFPPEQDASPFIDIKWMYVDQRYRGQSITDFIMAELVGLMIKRNASAITFGFEVNDHSEALIQLLAEWRFEMAPALNPEFRCRLGDIDQGIFKVKGPEPAIPLGELSYNEQKSMIRKYLKSTGQLARLSYPDKAGYYDGDLSCFLGKKEAPKGLLLVHKKPSGILEVEFFDRNPEKGETVLCLLDSCLDNALGKYGKKKELIIHTDSEDMEKLLDRIVSGQRVAPYIEAALTVPVGIDVTAEMLKGLFPV